MMRYLRRQRLQAVFLDRDGTINVKPAAGKYIRSPAELTLLPGAANAIAALNAAGLLTILVTNQRWLAEESTDSDSYIAVQVQLEQLLAREGARLDAAYCCPHAVGVCQCRKPGAGMLLRAAYEHAFDLNRAVIIGDTDSDTRAGLSVGAAAIRIGSPSDRVPDACADAVACDLYAAVRLLLDGGD